MDNLDQLKYKIQLKEMELRDLQKEHRHLTGQNFFPSGPLPEHKEKAIRCLQGIVEVLLDQIRYPKAQPQVQLATISDTFMSVYFWTRHYKNRLKQKIALGKEAMKTAYRTQTIDVDGLAVEYHLDEEGEIEVLNCMPKGVEFDEILQFCETDYHQKQTIAEEKAAEDTI